jgi:hypothetical protein
MCYATANNSGSPAEVARFLIKRFARVWPVYAVVTVLSVFVPESGVAYFHQAVNRLTFWHTLGMLPANPHAPPYFSLTLPIAWPLEFEMYSYLEFAVSLLFRRLRWFVLATWVLSTVILLPLGRTGLDMNVSRDLGYQFGYMSIVASPLVLEFPAPAGAAIGWLYHSRGRACAALCPLAYAVAGKGAGGPGEFVGVVATHGPAGFGWPLGAGAGHGAGQQDRPYPKTWLYIFLSTALALSVAALSHHYLEQGLATWCRKWLLKLVPERRPRAVENHVKAGVERKAANG